ncbi:MAG: MFS transporter [Caldilineaceae bacterium]|nr:MFS transporter [Caldilineaceae bacterium]
MSIQIETWRRRAIRRLLQLDHPISERSEAEAVVEMQRNFRWNFAFNFLDGAFFWFGVSFISSSTILPLFVSKLTTSSILIAMVAVIGQSSWYLPQLLTAGSIERLARKKPIVVNVGFFLERLPLFFLPIAALLSVSYPTLALLIFFIAYAVHGLGAGAVAPAWSDLIARCFPVERRGRFFGMTSFAGAGLGALGAGYSAWLLANFAFPINFALVFAIAALSIMLSWAFIAFTREPNHSEPEVATLPPARSQEKIARIVREDLNFRRYLGARLCSSLGLMGSAFLTVSAIERWDVADEQVGLFTAFILIGQTVGNLLAGLLADKRGHKVSLEVGLCLSVSTFVLAWWAPSAGWYYGVFFLLGAASGIAIVSGLLINLEFSQPKDRPTYVGIANTTLGVGSVVGPLLAGLIAFAGYGAVFAVSATFGLCALLILRFWVKEPRNHRQPYSLAVA